MSAGKATSDESPRLHVANKAGVGSYSKPKASSSSSSSYAAASFTAPPSPSPATLTVRTSSLSLHAVSRSSSTPNLPSSPPLHSGSGGNTHHHHHHHPKLSTNLYVKELLDSDTEGTYPPSLLYDATSHLDFHHHTPRHYRRKTRTLPRAFSLYPLAKGKRKKLSPLCGARCGFNRNPSLAPLTLRTHGPLLLFWD